MIAAGTAYPRIYLTFKGDTGDLLRTAQDRERVIYPLARRASIKDIIEGLGVPHTEVGGILQDGVEQSFEKIPHDGDQYLIEPLSPQTPPTVATFLRPTPLPACVFLVDINVGRLAGLLRMAGFDAAAIGPGQAAGQVVLQAVEEMRILLTRNRDLLKQRRLVFGHLVRTQDPDRQLAEIVKLYRLESRLSPFCRCIACNSLLVEVDKAAITDRLLPLTKRYFDRFKQCPDCGKIYWQGSHHRKMSERLRRIPGCS